MSTWSFINNINKNSKNYIGTLTKWNCQIYTCIYTCNMYIYGLYIASMVTCIYLIRAVVNSRAKHYLLRHPIMHTISMEDLAIVNWYSIIPAIISMQCLSLFSHVGHSF